MFRLSLFCAVTLLTGLASAAARSSDEPSVAAEGIRVLRAEVEVLRAERELAGEKGFYLKLDLRQRRISLVLAGVALEEHALERIETGVPRVAFLRRPPPSDWALQARVHGRLSPARERNRVEIVAPTPRPTADAAALEPIPPLPPPTAEEAYSVPTRYRIIFEGGVTLEVSAAGGGRNRSLLQRTADAVRLRATDIGNAVRPSPPERLRVRIQLDPDEAAALYRSLPPDVGLLVTGWTAR